MSLSYVYQLLLNFLQSLLLPLNWAGRSRGSVSMRGLTRDGDAKDSGTAGAAGVFDGVAPIARPWKLDEVADGTGVCM